MPSTLEQGENPGAAEPMPRPAAFYGRSTGIWVTQAQLKLGFLCLAALSGTGVIYRFGFQSIGWMALYAVTVIWFLRDWRQSARIFWQAWPVLLPSLVALASTLWSVNPPVTAYRSFQLLMTTLIAIRIATTIPAHRTMIVVSLTSIGGVALSYLNSMVTFLPSAFHPNGALKGIYVHKNSLAKAIVNAALGVVSLGFYWRLAVFGLLGAALLIPVLAMAQSAGAYVTFAILAVYVPVLMIRRWGGTARRLALIFSLLLLGSVPVFLVMGGFDAFGALLEKLGKDSTLTGRTVIWQFGLEEIADAPFAGLGFGAFWSVPSYARLYIEAYVDQGLFWFHNSYIELIVGNGLVGALVFFGLLLNIVIRCFQWFLNDGTVTAGYFLFYVLINLVAALSDNVIYNEHSIRHMLIVMAWIYAGRALGKWRDVPATKGGSWRMRLRSKDAHQPR
ncbi:O-antigen ligase [Phaeobacter sp.]|uniref:O-antigen ligase family protein n=1 Tax=Phaeobacter sp. TaxID=1902409 RepID=UPI0025D1B8C1|nr:O-antigen ligase [Phaeobacter sp.]